MAGHLNAKSANGATQLKMTLIHTTNAMLVKFSLATIATKRFPPNNT
jgi:hypothetical protein